MVNTRGDPSSAKRSSASSWASALKRSYMYPSLGPFTPQLLATAVAGALASGMGFNTLPPLPIISTISGFLTCLNLRIVGIDLGAVSHWF